MKPVYLIAVLVILGMLGYWLAFKSGDTEHAAMNIPIAFGTPTGGQTEMHVVVGVALANVSKARDSMAGKDKDWNGWMEDHFSLKDPSGKTVRFSRQGNSKVIQAHEVAQVVGTEEFFMVARVKCGQTYTLDYVEDLATRKTYRCTITVPPAKQKVQTFRFEPVSSPR